MMIDLAANLMPQVRAGKLKALAVTSRQRLASRSDLPTLDEIGLKGFDLVASDGIYAPSGTPQPIIEKFNQALNRALGDSEIVERLRSRGAEPIRGTPQEHLAHITREFPVWTRLVKDVGAKVD